MDKRSMVVVGGPYRVTSNGRRYFSKSHKEAGLAKCLAPGASLAAVALANGFNANLVRKWVRDRQAGDTLAKSSVGVRGLRGVEVELLKFVKDGVGSARSKFVFAERGRTNRALGRKWHGS